MSHLFRLRTNRPLGDFGLVESATRCERKLLGAIKPLAEGLADANGAGLLLRFVSLVSQLCLTSSSGRRFARFSLWGKVWGLHACALTPSNIHAQPFQNLTLLFSCCGL